MSTEKRGEIISASKNQKIIAEFINSTDFASKLETLVVEYGDKWIDSQMEDDTTHLVGYDGIYSVVADIAKNKSTDATAKNGGYLGKVPADKLVPEFTNAARALAKNSYSKIPVQTQFGYHIIFLKDKTPSKALTYEEVEGKISQILIGNAFGKKVKELTDELRKDAKIVIK